VLYQFFKRAAHPASLAFAPGSLKASLDGLAFAYRTRIRIRTRTRLEASQLELELEVNSNSKLKAQAMELEYQRGFGLCFRLFND
jgi:hypothetical protein